MDKTLRDEFAMAALQGCLAYSYNNGVTGNWQENSEPISLAKKCYAYADAMFEARNNPPKTGGSEP